jgi:hypothetical protein
VADQILRPLAQRLHFARKDQEHCRQTLTSLFRMVPGRGRRQINRRSLVGRECFPDALWILNVLGRSFHGEFAGAAEHWNRAAEASAAAARPAKKKSGAKGRSGSRRRPRGRHSPDEATGKPEQRESPARKPEKKEGPPPKWDNGEYFFAALPSVPDMPKEKGKGDRYGASEVAPQEEKAEKPKRKRRPRRRRKPSSGAAKKEQPKNDG